MGRQAYLNRLALGRSPYEGPENTTAELTGPAQRRVSAVYGDEYAQQYDERGHPVNVESKALGRDLRRAKNDILSTMGIVVSGKEKNAVISNEQHSADLIAAENDYGLIMATMDQVLVFLGSWWTTSLTARVQTFKRYTQSPLLKLINFERASIGAVGFYFSGIPAWAASTCVSICRHQPLDRLVNSLEDWLLLLSPNDALSRLIRSSCSLLHSAAKGTLLIVAVQTYMYSLLQSLHLVHPCSLPGLRLLVPFGEFSSMQFPSLPPNLSLSAMAQFGMGVLTAPPLLVYLSLYFKPVVEMRIYKLIRRRLPKPTHADETSIKVALDNDLIDWMVPSLGRRSEEEIVRSRLTLFQDIVNEIHAFKWWASWCFGLTKPKKYRKDRRGHFLERDSGMESLRHSVEELQNDLIAVESRARLSQQQSTEPQDTAGVQPPHNHAVRIQPSTPGPASSTRIPDPGAPFDSSRVLSNDENHISQSPDEMSAADLSEMAPLRRAGSVPPIGRPNQEVRRHNNGHSSRRNSRSNTLFSRPTSPESSPPTSPRVRASLIHQSSEIITMQLELLSHRNQHDQNLPTLRPGPHNQILNQDGVPDDPRSVTELLDNIISSRGPNLATPSDAVDSDGLSALTAGATPTRRNNETEPAIPNEQQAPAPGIGPETPRPDSPPVPLENVLPDDLDDPGPEPDLTQTETEQLFDPASLDPIRPPTSTSLHEPYRSGGPHRVTILACHPLDSLASHMSSIITNIMFIPFESLYLRSLATSYLASRASSPGQPLRSDIRPLSLWPGGSASSTLTYIGKLGLVMGIQAAVDASIWGVITGVAIRIGKGLCHWGDL